VLSGLKRRGYWKVLETGGGAWTEFGKVWSEREVKEKIK